MVDVNKRIGIKSFGKLLLAVTSSLLFILICYYNILFDLLLILLLLVESFAIGSFFKVSGTLFARTVMQTALGLGTIGMIIYFILLFGIGNKSIFILLLIVCGMVSFFRTKNEKTNVIKIVDEIKSYANEHYIYLSVLMLVFGVYLMYGSAPISMYDTLTKHLPITIYAAESGQWYKDVTESVLYGEAMVLQYTYSTLFYSLGANKALVLFNVVLFFCLYAIVGYFIKSIYKESNLWILGIILLTTPFFFTFSTVFYLEILPMYFLFSAFVGMGEIDKEYVWNNIENIALLCGFSLFVKLTHIFSLFIMLTIPVVCCIYTAFKTKIIKNMITKFGRCLILGILPSIVSLVYTWYKTGNPIYPFFNGLFHSPFFKDESVSDVFTNKLTLSWESITDIVFNTRNIEMFPLGFGIFLLFILVIPFALILFIRSKQLKIYFLWVVVSIVSYWVNTLTTYNIRYYFAVWVLLAGVITIGITICARKFPIKMISNGLCVLIGIVLLIPNLWYINEHCSFWEKIKKDETFVKNAFCEILEEIPSGKRVFSITHSNQLKGAYEGYFASSTSHNYTAYKINDGEYDWLEYLSSFDYILIDKVNTNKIYLKEDILDIVQPLLGEKRAENAVCEIYEVVPQTKTILHKEYKIPQETSVKEPIFEVFQNENMYLYIEHEVVNEGDNPVTMRYQINWMNESNELVDCYITTYSASPGKKVYRSERITPIEEASYGILYVVTSSEQKVKIGEYRLEGMLDVVEAVSEEYDDGSFWKNTENEIILQTKTILHKEYGIPQETSVIEPIFEAFQNEKLDLFIKHEVINEGENPITMRYQINWMNESNELVDCYITTYSASPGKNEYCSERIASNEEAAYGLLYVVTSDEQKVKIGGYTLEGILDVIK